jgi:hypothetical protein
VINNVRRNKKLRVPNSESPEPSRLLLPTAVGERKRSCWQKRWSLNAGHSRNGNGPRPKSALPQKVTPETTQAKLGLGQPTARFVHAVVAK